MLNVIAGLISLVMLGSLLWSYVESWVLLITHFDSSLGSWLWVVVWSWLGLMGILFVWAGVDEAFYEANHGHRRGR